MTGAYFAPNLVHGVCTYHCQWMPGSERGWRSRDHKRHSSGDYRHLPPQDEHSGLRQFIESQGHAAPVFLRSHECPIVGLAFVFKLLKMNCTPQALSCGSTHLHAMYRSQETDALKELGKPKQFSSLKLHHPSGQLWADGGKVIRVGSLAHAVNTFDYICDHGDKEGAYVWRHDRDPAPTGKTIENVIRAVRA